MRKLKLFLRGWGCLAIASFFAWGVWSEYKDVTALMMHGQSAVGTVVDYEYSQRRGRKGRMRSVHEHAVAFAGRSHDFVFDHQKPLGSRVNVLYATNNPALARASTDNASAFDFLKQDLFVILLAGCLVLWVGYSGISQLKGLIA